MSKIKAVGNGFIQREETLINLKGYLKIEKYNFGYDEDPEGNSAYGITFTPLITSEEDIKNGVDGSFMLTTYTFDEKEEFEKDFDLIISALKN